MAPPVGHVSEFNMKIDNFQAWLEIFEAYVTLNNIEENKQLLLFITILGNEAYTLLRNLCTPIEPKTKSYIELKKLLHDCQFGDLEDALCDQLLWGIRENKIRESLLAKEDLTYKICVETALSMEMAANEVSQLDKSVSAINYVASNQNKKKFPKYKDQENKGKPVRSRCTRCGKKNHSKDDCYFKDKTCNNCGKVGHITPVCKIRKQDIKGKDKSVNNLGEFESKSQDFNIEALNTFLSPKFNFIKPFEFKLQVNNIPIIFQKDSGSPISAISAVDVKRYSLHKVEIKATDRTFTDYVGNVIKPLGYIQVQVTYKKYTKQLDLYIFQKGGPPLMGREWIINLGLNNDTNKINNIRINYMDNIIMKYKEVFTNEIGCFKGEIHLGA